MLRLLNPAPTVAPAETPVPTPTPIGAPTSAAAPTVAPTETPVPTAAGAATLVTHGPTIVSIPSVDSDGDGTNDSYRADDVIRIEIGVSEQSCGDGALVITFQTGDGPSQIREAEYSECGPDSVYFEYRIADGDLDGDGISIAANSISLTTDGGDVLDATHPSVPPDPDHRVDAEQVDTTPQDSPLVVDPPSPESGGSTENSFVSVSAGFGHTCGVKTDGSVACWGDNEFDKSTPPGGEFASVSAGIFHTCGVKTDGPVVCWGDNEFNQSTPPGGEFASVSAGGFHTCGLKTDGLRCLLGFK